MKKKGIMLLPVLAIVIGLILCFSSDLKTLAKADDVGQGVGVFIDSGSYTFSGGTISGKTVEAVGLNGGGGVYVTGVDAIFTMSGGEISNNTPYGVYVENGASVTIDGGAISGNINGGLFANTNSNVIMNNGKIIKNGEAGSIFGTGFGVTILQSSFTINNGEISGNDSGVFVVNGNFLMEKGAISDNNSVGGGAVGGGVTVAGNGTFTMNDGAISGNSIAENDGGGGVRLIQLGTFIMNGGTISGNSSDRGGGGVYCSGTFTMNGGTIKGNKAEYGGGGVLIYDGSFTMNGGEISNNTAKTGSAIYVEFGGSFNYGGGIIEGEILLLGNEYSTFTIRHEPECTLELYLSGDPRPYYDGKVAMLEGIDTIDLSKIKLINYPDAKLAIKEVDGEKWIVMVSTYTVTISGDFNVIEGKYADYSSIPSDKLSEAVAKIELQVPEGTIITSEGGNCIKVGDTYVSVVDPPYGNYFFNWSFYEGSNTSTSSLPITVKSNVRAVANKGNEPTPTPSEPVMFAPEQPPQRQQKEYYIENKRTTIKSERKSKL